MRSRRAILIEGGSALSLAANLTLTANPARAAIQPPDFPFPGGNGQRPLTKDFPQ